MSLHAPASTAPRAARVSRRLSRAVLGLMAAQAGLGLLLPEAYRDEGWIRATWAGNDMVTLLLACPVLALGLWMGGRGSVAGRALWLGGLGYAVYNAPFYLFGAALNAFLPLYALTFVVAAWALVHYLVTAWADLVQPAPGRQRLSGGYLVFVAAGLSAVWIGLWAAHVFAGTPIATGTEAFKIVAAIDLTTLVPALGLGGVLLWTGHPAGPVIGGGAATMGALYLCVLLTNSLVLWSTGHAEGPGEAPIWAALLAGTLIAAAAILRRMPSGTRSAA